MTRFTQSIATELTLGEKLLENPYVTKPLSSYCLRTPPNLWPQTAPAVEPLQRLNLKDIWCVRSGFRSHARRKHCLPGHPFCRLGHTGLLVSRSGTYVQSLKLMQSRGFRRVNSHFGWLGLGGAAGAASRRDKSPKLFVKIWGRALTFC